MSPPFLGRPTAKSRELRERLTLIEVLVVGLPFLIVLYLHYEGRVSLAGWNILFFLFILLTVLAGLVLLRQFFEGVSEFVRTVKAAASGNVELLDRFRRTGELSGAAEALTSMAHRMESTNIELSRKVKSLSVMREMLHMANGSLDLDALLSKLLGQAMILSGSEMGSVFTLDQRSSGFRLVRFHGPCEAPPAQIEDRALAPIMSRVLSEKKALRVADIENDPRVLRENNPKYGHPSFICLPVLADGETVGIINLARKENLAAFDEEDENLLFLVCSEMGFALQNAFLSRKIESLEQGLGVRNGELAQERAWRRLAEEEKRKLSTQLAMAQKVQAMGTLAGGVAHDFNNLLMAIQGNVSLMLLDVKPEGKEFVRLKNIERQIASGSKLTGRLLGYLRKNRSESTAVDLNRLLLETSETFGRTRKDISVILELAGDIPFVSADPSQLEQVLWNLYANASDAMSAGGKVHIETRRPKPRDLEGKDFSLNCEDFILLRFRDTGSGMDEETRKRAFEPFFTTKSEGKGTGLGLSSVKDIVSQHGGFIHLTSAPEQGALFEIFLPSNGCAAPPPDLETSAS
ncbi:MAG: ATP-binding protein [Thermodesulfobacteriota bacterium]